MASPSPPGLLIRPAPRIVRELPPSLATYRVTLFFHALRLKSYYRVEYGSRVETKKPLKQSNLVETLWINHRARCSLKRLHLLLSTTTVGNIADQ